MSHSVHLGQTRHEAWLTQKDGEVDKPWIRRCLAQGEYLISEERGLPVGFLRWSWFWGKVPYIDMIRVETAFQGQGIGTALLTHLQDLVSVRGATLLMTSCESGAQEPLAWHLKNGFERTGEIAFPTIQEPSEVFLAKRLG